MLKTGDIVLLKPEQNRLGIVTIASEDNLVIYPTWPAQFSFVLRRAAAVKGHNIKSSIENLLNIDPIEIAVESCIYEPDYDKIIRLDNIALKDIRFPIGSGLCKSDTDFEIEGYDGEIASIVAPWTEQRVKMSIEKILKTFPDDLTVMAIKDIVSEVFGHNDGIKNNRMLKTAATFNGEKKEVAKKKTSRVLRGAALRAVIKKT